MNILLWILQVLIAAQFLQHGWMLVFPPPEYVQLINDNLGIGFRYFLGIAELLAAVGILLPGILRIHTWVIPLTAAGLTIVSVSATVYHLVRGETSSTIYTAVLSVIVIFVGYMRWKVKPIPARGTAQR